MEDETPTLLTLMFGQAAGTVLRAAFEGAASPRLLAWAEAFDEWLDDRDRRFCSSARGNSYQAWRRFFEGCSRMPWELQPADITRHIQRLQARGLATGTIFADIGLLSAFFRWCSEKAVDPLCPPSFNPAAGVKRPSFKIYTTKTMLSRGEVDALLRVLRADHTPFGMRDYALFLARLRLGVPDHLLRQLQWGQLTLEGPAAWVHWRPASPPSRLPDEVWQAMRAYLLASGRLGSLESGSFLFVPLRDLYAPDPGRRPGDWSPHPLSSKAVIKNLKNYGRLAGIPAQKLTLRDLRRTAIRLRLDEGCTQGEIYDFIGFRGPMYSLNRRLRALPPLPPDPPGLVQGEQVEGIAPNHRPHLYTPDERRTHGFLAACHPPEAIQAILAEDVQGVDEQIVGLRALGRGLLERQSQAADFAEAARLGDLYTRVASWLSEMVQAGSRRDEPDEDRQKVELFLDLMAKVRMGYALTEGHPPYVDTPENNAQKEQIKQQLLAELLGSDPDFDLASHQLHEEIATLRYLLRNALHLAAGAADTAAYVRIVELYGNACIRLSRLLRRGDRSYSHIVAEMDAAVDRVVAEIMLEWDALRQAEEERQKEALAKLASGPPVEG